jgi:hypothetical protein
MKDIPHQKWQNQLNEDLHQRLFVGAVGKLEREGYRAWHTRRQATCLSSCSVCRMGRIRLHHVDQPSRAVRRHGRGIAGLGGLMVHEIPNFLRVVPNQLLVYLDIFSVGGKAIDSSSRAEGKNSDLDVGEDVLLNAGGDWARVRRRGLPVLEMRRSRLRPWPPLPRGDPAETSA